MLSFTALKYKNRGTAGSKSGVDMQGGIAVIKKIWVVCESELMFWVAWQSFAVFILIEKSALTSGS
jgi:hypothetical protein